MDLAQSVMYLSFFGQVQSGPISRYELFDSEKYSPKSNLHDGIVRFMIGFSKKVILADVLSNVTIEVFDRTYAVSPSLVWLGAICYSLQLFYDFSGYSDMAIGIGNMLGYECPENFVYPYMTKSVAEFWRRWHISLGSWFRDYVYIPMGGSRVGKWRLYFNLLTVWILTGIWHGAGWNFIIWGFGYFVLIAFEKTMKLPERLPNCWWKWGYRILTLLFINFQWVLFRCDGMAKGILYIKTMFGFVQEDVFIPSTRAAFLLKDYVFFIIIALIFSIPVVKFLENLCKKNVKSAVIYEILSSIFIVTAFIVALSFIVSGQNSPFLYGNF